MGRTYSPEHSAPAFQGRTAPRTGHSAPALRAGLLSLPLLPLDGMTSRICTSKHEFLSAEIAEKSSQGFSFRTTFDMHGGPRSAGSLDSSPFAGRCAGTARTRMPRSRIPVSEGTHSQPNERARLATAAAGRNVMWMDVDAGVDDAQGIARQHHDGAASAARLLM